MSRFSGKQYKGANKNLKDIKREEAEERAIKFKNNMTYLRNRRPEERLLDAIFGLDHLDSPLYLGADLQEGMYVCDWSLCSGSHPGPNNYCSVTRRMEEDPTGNRAATRKVMFEEAEIINDLIDGDVNEELEITPYG